MKYNKKNLAKAFKNLSKWANNLDEKNDKYVISATWDRLVGLMEKTMWDSDELDIFGKGGYESMILEKDKKSR